MTAWADIATRSSGYKVLASDYNDLVNAANLANSGTASKGRPSVMASSTDASTITRNTWQLMTFTATDDWDTASMHNTSSNTSRLVVPSDGAGLYRIVGRVSTDTTASTFSPELMIRLNAAGSSSGGTYVHHAITSTAYTPDSTIKFIGDIDWTVRLAASDYVELFYKPLHATTDYAMFGGTIPHKFGMIWLTA